MQFDELKKIWDTQTRQPMYVIEENTFNDLVMKKISRVKKEVDRFQKGIIIICLIVMSVLSLLAWMNENWYQFITVVVAAMIAIYIYNDRRHRKRSQDRFGKTLMEDLDLAIQDADYMVKRGKYFTLWYLAPLAISMVVSLILESKSIWSWIVVLLSFTLAYFVSRWDVYKCQIPRKKALENMREALLK